MYAYWKDKGKLRKKYISKSWRDWQVREIIKKQGLDVTLSQVRKSEFLSKQAESNNNELAKRYIERLEGNNNNNGRKVTIDWAYKCVRQRVIDQRARKILAI